MQIRTKLVLLFFVALIAWGVEQFLFLGPGPSLSAEMAVEQIKSNRSLAENLRVVDTTKNYLTVTAVGGFALLLFLSNIYRLLGVLTGRPTLIAGVPEERIDEAIRRALKVERMKRPE